MLVNIYTYLYCVVVHCLFFFFSLIFFYNYLGLATIVLNFHSTLFPAFFSLKLPHLFRYSFSLFPSIFLLLILPHLFLLSLKYSRVISIYSPQIFVTIEANPLLPFIYLFHYLISLVTPLINLVILIR